MWSKTDAFMLLALVALFIVALMLFLCPPASYVNYWAKCYASIQQEEPVAKQKSPVDIDSAKTLRQKQSDEITKKSICRLIVLLADKDEGVRTSAVWALGRIGRPASQFLVDALKTSKNKIARVNAAKALERCKDPQTIDFVIELSKDDDPEVRSYAADAIGKIASQYDLISNHSFSKK
jgi:HEAT repeat protein